MKKLIKTGMALLLTAAGLTGCESFLEEELKSQLAPDNTFTSTIGFEVGSGGLYAIARSEYNTWGASAFMHNTACPYEALQIATDIVSVGSTKDSSIVPFAELTMSPTTSIVKSYWNWSYSLIGAANEILVYSEKNNNWDYPTDKARFQAEARFFRAYAYRTLVYLYGDVTWTESIQQPFRTDFTRTSKDEVIAHMVEDLKFAADYLPEDPDPTKLKEGKLTKWAALHLLSEIYLLQGEYALAAKAASDVIASGFYRLMKTRFGVNKDQPGDVFSDMFLENNQNRKSGNEESIWVMQFEYNITGGGGRWDDWTRRAWSPKYHDMTNFALSAEYGGRGLNQITPMKWWIGTQGTNATAPETPLPNGIFPAGDMRNSEYNIKRTWYPNNPASATKANITDATWFTSGQLYPALTKFFFGKAENLGFEGNNKDRMKFRLAETYLLLCEAYLGMGDIPKARAAINEVRNRAGATPLSDSEVTMDELLDERIRELVGEESRRFTLVRTDTYLERVKKYNDYLKDKIQDHHALWPIPQEVRDAVQGSEYPQNPGYN